MKAEKIAGTRAVAERLVNSVANFCAMLQEQYGLTEEQATNVWNVYVAARLVRWDSANATYRVKHGAFLDREVVLRAAEAR